MAERCTSELSFVTISADDRVGAVFLDLTDLRVGVILPGGQRSR